MSKNKKQEYGKITLGMLKGKSVTTSVPSISVKFHANAEQIEEFYVSEDEGNSTRSEKTEKAATVSSSPVSIGDSESSPLKIFPKLVKRSTSVDVSNTQCLDASPPSDPWRFFSDIKGKITKSVEEKITEIKSRNHEEGSPQHKAKSELKTIKDGKESCSVSDDEDLSESSISKTCGIISTTEGVEMSSDEDTPSLDKDKKPEKTILHSPTSIRHRFRFFRNRVSAEGTVKEKDLSKIYNITAEKNDEILREDSEDVESAVDALEDADLKYEHSHSKINIGSNDSVLTCITEKIDNIEIDDDFVHIKEVSGKEIREDFFDCREDNPKTVYAPTGFVDLRPPKIKSRPFYNYLHILIIFLSIIVYMIIQYYSPYIAGLAAGIIISFLSFQIYVKISPMTVTLPKNTPTAPLSSNKILEIQAVTEYQPLQKYEGWANEYPDTYNAETYHISRTQSVFMRLQGNLLRISHSKTKVPKRAMWNEQEINMNFTHHRIYNLIGAKIKLLPEGLAKKRHWSKKYPICITLSKDQMCFNSDLLSKLESEDEKHTEKDKNSDKDKPASSPKEKKTFGRFRKKEYPILAQRFSKLTADDGFDFDSDSRASTPSAELSDAVDSSAPGDEDLLINEQPAEEFSTLPEDWSTCSPPEISPDELNIYIFGRTDREKEDWFRRLCIATHKGIGIISVESSNPDIKEAVSDALIDAGQIELEYLKYMNTFKCSRKLKSSKGKDPDADGTNCTNYIQNEDHLLWLNSLIGRVLFDCMRNPSFIDQVKDRIQRKLSTIKLPYFIEELLIPELSLGKTPPLICRSSKPVVDDRGLWVDLDITYEGLIVLTLQTKLNLMRLKNPQAYDKSAREIRSAIYHSDVDDSAESSSDEEGPQEIPNLIHDTAGTPTSASNSSHGGKKFIKMVDKLAESKFFQAATDNKYIKKAMEGVSNTDLRLTVEVRSIEGTLVLNVPPPPSDRIWIGFRPTPEIALSARPIVGERHLSYIMVTSWIEKKLLLEFQKVMVIPNMEDFVIPVMNPKLPE